MNAMATPAAPGLETAEGMRRFAEGYRELAQQLFAEKGHLPSLVGFVCTYAPAEVAGLQLDAEALRLASSGSPFGATAIAATQRNEAEVRGFVGFVREIARATKAIGIVTAFESWHVRQKPGVPRPAPGTLHLHPDREELLLVLVEHIRLATPDVWYGEIKRDGAGRGHVESFRRQGISRMEGRFTDILNRTRFA